MNPAKVVKKEISYLTSKDATGKPDLDTIIAYTVRSQIFGGLRKDCHEEQARKHGFDPIKNQKYHALSNLGFTVIPYAIKLISNNEAVTLLSTVSATGCLVDGTFRYYKACKGELIFSFASFYQQMIKDIHFAFKKNPYLVEFEETGESLESHIKKRTDHIRRIAKLPEKIRLACIDPSFAVMNMTKTTGRSIMRLAKNTKSFTKYAIGAIVGYIS